jgi:hypothetical protein
MLVDTEIVYVGINSPRFLWTLSSITPIEKLV